MAHPIKPPHDPDSQIACEAALEDAFLTLADEATAEGWDYMLVARALRSLANNHLLGQAANREISKVLHEAVPAPARQAALSTEG